MRRIVAVRIEKLLREGIRRGWQRGVLGGERAWAVVGGVSLVAHLGARAWRRQADVVFSEKLGPGEAISIRHEPRP